MSENVFGRYRAVARNCLEEKFMNENKLMELVESWINGNRSYVREQARKLSSKDVYHLASLIEEHDSKEQAVKFIDLL